MLTRIDELTRWEYRYLQDGDLCFFLREYTAGQGFSYSETNNLISNFKKPPSVRNTGQWYWKQQAIERLAAELAPEPWLADVTLVPIPPSKAREDPEYDDRLIQLLHRLDKDRGYDIRELLVQRASTPAAHASTAPRSPSRIAALYDIDESLAEPAPDLIGLFDDVITTGAHFRAAHQVLQQRFPGVTVAGIFLARTVRLSADR